VIEVGGTSRARFTGKGVYSFEFAKGCDWFFREIGNENSSIIFSNR